MEKQSTFIAHTQGRLGRGATEEIGLGDRAKITSAILAWPFARWLRCSRLPSGQNSYATITEFIFARPPYHRPWRDGERQLVNTTLVEGPYCRISLPLAAKQQYRKATAKRDQRQARRFGHHGNTINSRCAQFVRRQGTNQRECSRREVYAI